MTDCLSSINEKRKCIFMNLMSFNKKLFSAIKEYKKVKKSGSNFNIEKVNEFSQSINKIEYEYFNEKKKLIEELFIIKNEIINNEIDSNMKVIEMLMRTEVNLKTIEKYEKLMNSYTLDLNTFKLEMVYNLILSTIDN